MRHRINFEEKNTLGYERSILNETRYYEFFKVDNMETSNALKKVHVYKHKLI
jgi:hypothetical protein